MAVDLDPLAGRDGGDDSRDKAKFWHTQLEKIRDDARHKRWIKRCESIEKRYRDERTRTDEEGQRRANVLWTNIEILTPAIYGKCPVPVAERRFRDKDPAGRGAAQILERALRNEIEICNFDEAMQQAVRDYLLVGRGVTWLRYEPEVEEGVSVTTEGGLDEEDTKGEFDSPNDDEEINHEPVAEGAEGEEGTEPEVADDALRMTGDRITRESTPVDYVHWNDFFTMPFNARIWKEVVAVGRRVYMPRERMKARFGNKIAKEVPLRKDERGAHRWEGPDQDPDNKGEVYEIWSLVDREVLWIAEGYEYLLDRKDDPLRLEHFFPCPRPIYSNMTNSTLIPIPDFLEYQDQAIQIDELSQRISMLSKACKVAGVYNSAATDIKRLLDESVENELIPVDDWAAFGEKGGIEGNISLLPLKDIIGCLNELVQIKEKIVEELDRLTGISDIMRGTTDARETLGGQRLKTNNTGTRLQRRQNEIARFARDTVRIMADIMSTHFSPLSLIEASGALYEEGLGVSDMPELTSLQPQPGQPPMPPQQAPFSGPPQAPGSVPPPPRTGPTPLGGPMPPPAGMPGTPPPMPGTNVVPFAPPGRPPLPMGGPPPAMGQPPMGQMQTFMGQPSLPPEIQGRFQGLKRISDAIQLLRNERLRGFRVDIEVDSTIFGDSESEKKERVQFMTTVTQFLQQSMMMSNQVPEIAPLLGKFLQFGVRGFHVGRDLELAIEEFSDSAVKIAQQRKQEAQQTPNPQMLAAQASMVKAQAANKAADAKASGDQAKLQGDMALQHQKIQGDAMQAQAEVQRQQVENQGEQANNAADMQMKQMDLRMRNMEMFIEQIRAWTQLQKAQHMQTQQMQQTMGMTSPPEAGGGIGGGMV